MKHALMLALSCFCISNTYAASFELVNEGQEPLYQTQLNKQVYQQSRSENLQDLTVQNASGEQVPYAIVPAATLNPVEQQKNRKQLAFFPVQQTRLAQPEALRIELGQRQVQTNISVNSEQNQPSTQLIYLVDLGEKHAPYKTFIADWQGQQNQLIQLELLSSDDLKYWQQNGRAVLLATQHDEKTEGDSAQQILQNTLTLETASTARYLQIKPVDPSTERPFTLSKLSAEQTAPAQEQLHAQQKTLLWHELPLLGRHENSQQALITLDFEAAGHYPASHLKISLPQDNTITQVLVSVRNTENAPWLALKQAPLYRMTQNGRTATNPDIEITPTTTRFWQLQFNQASGGIGKDNAKLSLGWQPDTIIWNARGQAPFTLQVGETARQVNQIGINGLMPKHKLADLLALPKATLQANDDQVIANTWQNPVNYQRYLLWAGLLLGVGLLACMAYSLFKTANNAH